MRLPTGVRWILRLAGALAPRSERRAFTREWSAELQEHRRWLRGRAPRASRAALYLQTLGAISDALGRRREDLLGGLLADIRFGLRSLVRHPVFTLLAVGTVGLGIGATSAIYILVDGVLLRPLPYRQPEQLVSIWGRNVADDTRQLRTSQADFADYVAQSRSLTAIVGFSSHNGAGILRIGGGTPIKVAGTAHTEGLFAILGVEAALGRTFTAAEHAGRASVVVLSNHVWRQMFGADPAALGTQLEIDAVQHTVIGIMPAEFGFPDQSAFWVPTNARAGDDAANTSDDSFGRDWRTLRVVARLAEGVDVASADADIRRIAANLEVEYPTTNTDHSAYAESLHAATVASATGPLSALMVAVCLVLAIACANVGGLLLARASDRRSEMAVRAALGAGKRRIVRLLLTESLLLAFVGGVAGVLAGQAVLSAFLRASPVAVPRVEAASLDLRVVLAMFAVTTTAGVLFGLAPAAVASRADLQQTLRDASRRGSARGHLLLRSLVIAQVTLSTVLVVTAGLFATSFSRLLAVDHGYATEHLLTFQLNIGFDRYPGWDRFIDFFDRSREAVGAIPGIEAVEHINVPPLRAGWESWYHIEGTPEVERGARPQASLRSATPGFFDLAGLRVLDGRGFLSTDDRSAPGVAVVNETFARRAFADGEALGQRLEKPQFWGDEFPTVHEIVGIVEDSRSDGLATTPSPTVYFPFGQVPFGGNTLFVRTTRDAASLAPALRATITRLDGLLPVEALKSVDDMVDESAATHRFAMLLTGAFGVLALVLANIGLYGVLSYSIAERTAEFGLRRALGAGHGDVLRMVLGKGLSLALIGIGLGLGASVLVTRAIESSLYGISATDPRTYLLVAVSMVLVAALACWVPGARALRVDPMVAMDD